MIMSRPPRYLTSKEVPDQHFPYVGRGAIIIYNPQMSIAMNFPIGNKIKIAKYEQTQIIWQNKCDGHIGDI